jgi:hypothetical protein
LPKTKGKVYLLDEAGSKIDISEYNNMPKGSSWSLVDDEWTRTFAITEGAANIFKEYCYIQRYQSSSQPRLVNKLSLLFLAISDSYFSF